MPCELIILSDIQYIDGEVKRVSGRGYSASECGLLLFLTFWPLNSCFMFPEFLYDFGENQNRLVTVAR